MKIALDAMGGDFGPLNLVSGAVMALREYPRIEKLILVGDTPQIEATAPAEKLSFYQAAFQRLMSATGTN